MKNIGILKTVYNQSHLVDRVVRNINNYASPQLQTFIQDDCSKDNTYDLYLKAVPNFTRIYKTERNFGARANISSLVQKCDTDYLTFSAGDDFIYPPTARQLVRLIENDDPDIVITKCIHASDLRAYSLTLEDNISAQYAPEACRNAQIFGVNWSNCAEILVAAATTPGLLWSQGLVIKTSLAKRAGFPPSGEVDDWGFQHNLAVIALSENLRITLVDRILGILSVQPHSMGSEVTRQLERQIQAIHHHWDPRLKKAALLNCLTKKLKQMRSETFTYDNIRVQLAAALSQTL